MLKSFIKSFIGSSLGFIAAGIIFFVLIPMLFVFLFSSSNFVKREDIEPRSVLHVLLNGEVMDSSPGLDGLLGDGRPQIRLQKVIRAIRIAKKDPRVIGLVVDMRNPSMGWASATAIRRELGLFQESKKFSFTYADRLDELGLYIASGTDRTIMQPNGDVELDGLSSEVPFLKGLLQKLEIQPEIFRVGRFKAAVEPLLLDKMSAENREQNQVLLGDIWDEAATQITKSSKISRENLDGWMSNLSIKTVDDAKNAKIVSDLMYSDEFDALIRGTAGWEQDGPQKYVSISRMAAAGGEETGKGKKKLALLIAEGEIVKGESAKGSIGDDSFLEALAEIENDPDVAAVVVRINSPGGDALASDIIWRQMTVLDEKIPIVASMGDMAASGGYYIASGARRIFAEPTTITGSIGVFGVMFNAERLFKNKLGISFDRVATHQFANHGGISRPLAPEEAKSIQASVEKTYQRFVGVVAQSRGFEKVSDVEAIAEGRVWSGARAVKLGLVDELGSLDRALAKAAELGGLGDQYRVVTFPRPIDRLSRFLETVADSSDTSTSVSLLLKPVLSVVARLFALPFFNHIGLGPNGLSAAGVSSKELRLIIRNLGFLGRAQESGELELMAREPVSAKSIR